MPKIPGLLRRGGGLLIAIALLGTGLAEVSSGFTHVSGWPGFAGMLLLASGLIWGVQRFLRNEFLPRWVVGLTVGGALLRLGAGVLWFVALPTWGYADSPVNQAGYIMEDAFQRDATAWELAQSDQPLLTAFTDYRSADQYGGLLFISAAGYRYLGGATHTPLLIVVLTAFFSALAIPFTWAFVRRLWGMPTASLAAWGMALYPEAVLLGSSQMREAFMISIAAAALYGLTRFWQDRSRGGLAWLLGAIVLGMPLSPALTAILLGSLGILAWSFSDWRIFENRRLWLVLGGLAVLVGAVFWIGWDQIAPGLSAGNSKNPLEAVTRWARYAFEYQAYLSKSASGWVQKVFRSTPEGFHMPFLVGYGIVRPLLPAAIFASGAPIWKGIGVWRALGWTLLLPLLVYAPLRVGTFASDRKTHHQVTGFSLAVWAILLVASTWGGGDLWDNPRYRVAFLSLQIGLAAWAIVGQRRVRDPWLRRLAGSAVLFLVWFGVWYLSRYFPATGWPVRDLFKTLGLSAASSILYIIWDWAKE